MPPDTPSRTHDPGLPVRIVTVVMLYAAFASLWILLSDRAVEWMWTDPAHIILASTLKGWAFVAVTSLLLYGSMRRIFPVSEQPPVRMTGFRPMLFPMGLTAAVVAILTFGGVIHTISHERDKEEARLEAIADLKSRQIEDWLGERYGDAAFVQCNRLWPELYRRWRADGDASSGVLLRRRLNDFHEHKSFQAVWILDAGENAAWTSTGEARDADPALRAAAGRALRDKKVIHSGPYRDAEGGVYLDFIAPLEGGGGRFDPVVILRTDFARRLFPILRWPTPSASGEALLFRREGDQIVVLNELRHQADTAVRLRMPVAAENLLAARILRGDAAPGGLLEGADYRGAPVMGVACAIRGTDWYIIAKMDKAEIYAQTVGDILWILMAGMTALFMAAAAALLLHQRRKLSASLHEQEIQAEKLRALQLLEAIADNSSDAIFAKDAEGRFLFFNRAASRYTGKALREVIGRDATVLFPPEKAALHMNNDRKVMADNRHATFQEDIVTADGEVATFLVMKSPLRDAFGHVVGVFGISRDITERRQAEQERETAVLFLRLLNETNGRKGLIRSATDFFKERSGCEAVGIRLKEGDDYPYYETRGFPSAFVKAENSLCARTPEGEIMRDGAGDPLLECMCGNVICGRFDPAKSFFTRDGSFWSNCTTELLATTTDADRQARTRNRCNGSGYESVALIALHVGEERLGLLQLNDRRKNRFTLRDMELWERLAGYLAVSLAKITAEERLRESEERLRAIIDNAENIIWFKDLDRRFLMVNPYAERALGRPAGQWLGRTAFDVFPRDLVEGYDRQDRLVIDTGRPLAMEQPARFEDGIHTFLSMKFPVRNPAGTVYGIGAICTDITERKRMEKSLRDSLEEKTALLKEVHHRVKNNLQIVASLLHLQAGRSPHPEAVVVLRDTANRVRSMALLHEMLYQSGNLACINFPSYVREVCTQLVRAHGPTAARIRVEYDAAPVSLTMEQAAPCGLIISELVSNSLKHGFPGDRAGRVSVGIHPEGEDRVVLSVRDDGVGLPPGFAPSGTSTLGLKLASNLADQLGGRLAVTGLSDGGAGFTVIFPVSKNSPDGGES